MKMNGQWLGNALVTTTNTPAYLCILNLDIKGESYEGRILLFYLPFQKEVSIVARVKINKYEFDSDNGIFTGKLYDFLPIRPENCCVGNWNEFPKITKDQISETGDVKGSLKDNEVTGVFKTDKNYNGRFDLKFYSSTEPSNYPSEKISWEDFKNSVLKIFHTKNSSLEGSLEEKVEESGDCVHCFTELAEQISFVIEMKIYQLCIAI